MPPVPDMEAVVSESPTDDREGRRDRALAIACASVSFRGEAMNVESLLALADEFLSYIQGDNDAVIPRPDLLRPGYLPRGKKR